MNTYMNAVVPCIHKDGVEQALLYGFVCRGRERLVYMSGVVVFRCECVVGHLAARHIYSCMEWVVFALCYVDTFNAGVVMSAYMGLLNWGTINKRVGAK